MNSKLSSRDQDIMTTIYRYRGMTALQLTQKVHNSSNPKQSQKSSIHNYLKRLKKQKIVASKKLEDEVGVGSIYYLTPNGFQMAKDLLNIDIGQIGEGYMFADDMEGYHTHGDLDYIIYKPPLQQMGHHLLLIDSLIKLDYLDTEEQIDYRLSMYATRKYEKGFDKLRPDAELLLSNSRSFFLEIDKGTEGYQQLVEKFTNYRNYLSQLKMDELPIGILFITDTKRQMYGLKRRWTYILAAYMNAMGELATKVNLILCPLNKLEEIVLFEVKRPEYNRLAIKKLKKALTTQHQSVRIKKSSIDNSLWYAIVTIGNKHQLVFSRVVNEFESSAYSYLFFFHQNIKSFYQLEKIPATDWGGFKQSVLFYKNDHPYLPSHFPVDKWSRAWQTTVELLHDCVTYMPL